MSKNFYGDTNVLMALENPMIRQGLQNALQSEGIGRAVEAVTLERMLETLRSTRFDILLVATELGTDLIPPVISQLRLGQLNHHPLPIIILLLLDQDSAYIRRAIDCGPDDILNTPISPKQLIDRLRILATTRKTFVVTSNYVGPDRRSAGPRAGAMEVPLLDVPNPLAMKKNRVPGDQILQEIDSASIRLKMMRLARHSFELQWLLRAVQDLFVQTPQDAARFISFCERIKTLTCGLPDLMESKPSEKLAQIIEHVEKATNILLREMFETDPEVMRGLGRLIPRAATELRIVLPEDLGQTTIIS